MKHSEQEPDFPELPKLPVQSKMGMLATADELISFIQQESAVKTDTEHNSESRVEIVDSKDYKAKLAADDEAGLADGIYPSGW